VPLRCVAWAVFLCGWVLPGAEDPPRDWIEPATGHRVVRLSDRPGTASLYFHQNPYTASGDTMVVSTPDGLGREDDLVRPADAEEQGVLAGRRRRRHGQDDPLFR
jgi:hypothetical protein